jgi:hypothetical protein
MRMQTFYHLKFLVACLIFLGGTFKFILYIFKNQFHLALHDITFWICMMPFFCFLLFQDFPSKQTSLKLKIFLIKAFDPKFLESQNCRI